MVEVLNGSNWSKVQTIQESDNVYVYKFMKNGKSVWVAWNDDNENKTLDLNVGDIQSITITEAIPKYDSGKEISNYETAFNTESKSVSNGQISLILNDIPVFVEQNE
jgi:hypothetical protein